jgi:hypothetical protein
VALHEVIAQNGLILAATGTKGMPLIVETSVAFSVLVALVVIGVFLFCINYLGTGSIRSGNEPCTASFLTCCVELLN